MVCGLFLTSCQGTANGDQITHILNLEQINPLDKNPLGDYWAHQGNQVVVYFQGIGEYSTIHQDWNTFILNNPSVKFIFYYSGGNLEGLSKLLIEKNFEVPIILDPEMLFYKKNVVDRITFISYLVKNGEIVGMSNPSMPNFQEKLDELEAM